jgi:hypothetical protein
MRLVWVSLTLLPTVVGAQWHLPLDVRNHRSADLAFLRLTPRSHTARPGETLLSLSLVESNELRRSGPILEDAEVFRPLLAMGRGLPGGYEVFFELPLVVRGGGFMDAAIEWWHGHVINHRNPVREAMPIGRAHIEFPGSGSVYGDAVSVGDTTLGAAKELCPGLIARLAVKLPTGNPTVLAGSGGLDAGAAIDWRIPLAADWTLDLNGGYILQGRPSRMTEARRGVYASAIAVTWRAGAGEAWTLQLSAEQAPTRTGNDGLDNDHRVLSLGYQKLLRDGSVLQLYFSENGDVMGFPGGPTVGPDLTIAARIVKRY